MLRVSEQIKEDFLVDGRYKEMLIQTEAGRENTYDKINFYTGSINETAESKTFTFSDPAGGHDWLVNINDDDAVIPYQSYGRFIYVSFLLKITSYNSLPNRIYFVIYHSSEGDSPQYAYELDLTDSDTLAELTGDGKRIYARITSGNINYIDWLLFVVRDGLCDMTCEYKELQVSLSDVAYMDDEVEEGVPYLGESIARQGQSISDYIYKGDVLPIADITNEELEVESYIQTESLSSGENLKFGACEASFCEFTVRNRNDNWKDRYINPYICLYDERFTITWVNFYAGSSMYTPSDVQTHNFSNMTSQLRWVMGTNEPATFGQLTDGFKQHKGDKKVVCVSYKAKLEVTECSEDHLEKIIMGVNFYNGSSLHNWWFPAPTVGEEHCSEFNVSDITNDFVQVRIYIPQDISANPYNQSYFDDIQRFVQVRYQFLHNDRTAYSSGTISYKMYVKEIQINLVDHYYDEVPEWDIEDCIEYNGTDINEYKMNKTGNIPLGRFCVKEISKVHKTGVQQLKLTAYDDLIKLDTNAYNWYIKYMWGFNTSDYTSRYGLECTRQIYSAYHNIMYTLGIERRRTFYPETVIQHHEDSDIGDLSNGEKTFIYSIDSSSQIQIRWAAFVVADADCMHPYSADVAFDEAFIRSSMRNYAIYVDRQWRGCDNANIIIQPLNGDNLSLFCVDSYDLFMIPPNCTSFKVWYPYKMVNDTYISGDYIYPVSSVEICKSSRYVDLVNASTRLMYYRWMGDHEIFSVDSSITARDVVRSLLEVTGCFLHIDRYGKPAFKYCTKSGLYPANDLYPADDLYPRGLDGSTLSLDGYISAETEDYSVKDIGRIQIVKQQINNENSVVEWEYIGDASMQNTYLIDDNIFYCNESMEYEYGSMQDVADMLENMYNRISNMGYMPGKFIITGMPWLEVGDRIGLLTFAGGVETFVFRRTYKGIIAPKDTIVSQGDEYIEAVKDYGYIVS